MAPWVLLGQLGQKDPKVCKDRWDLQGQPQVSTLWNLPHLDSHH